MTLVPPFLSVGRIKVPVDRIISTNTAYGQRGRIRYLSREGKQSKKIISEFLSSNHNDIKKTIVETCIKVEFPVIDINYYLVDNWLTKKNTVKRIDLNPRIKLIEDTFFEWLDIDDCIVFSSSQKKLHSTVEKAVIYELSIMSLDYYIENNKV